MTFAMQKPVLIWILVGLKCGSVRMIDSETFVTDIEIYHLRKYRYPLYNHCLT
jgi:hypothetical protein